MLQIYIYIYIHITILFFCLIINNNYKINIYIDTRSITDKVWKLSIPKIYGIYIKKMTRDYWLPSLEKSNLTFSLENPSEKKRKRKRKESFLPKEGNWLTKRHSTRACLYIYIYMITHRQPAIITKERESGRTHE
jgi:hypothetical protein